MVALEGGIGKLFLIARLRCENTRTPSYSLPWLHWRMVCCSAMFSPKIMLLGHRKLSPWHPLTSSQGFTKKTDPCRLWAPRSESELTLYGFLQISGSPLPYTFITVEIKGPTQRFIKKKSIQIIKAESPVFVQTDKPIYKPGQIGIKNSLGKNNTVGEEGWWCSLRLNCSHGNSGLGFPLWGGLTEKSLFQWNSELFLWTSVFAHWMKRWVSCWWVRNENECLQWEK